MTLLHRRLSYWMSLALLASILAGCNSAGGQAAGQPAGPASTSAPTSGAPQPAPQATAPATEPPLSGSGPWKVTFAAEDGTELSGTLYGNGKTAIVLAPTYPGGPAGWDSFARSAVEKGYRALTFDFRGYGSSKASQIAADFPTDVRAAVKYVKDQGAEKIILVGAGLGGTAAILVASKDSALSGVALVSASRGVEGLQVADADLAALKIPSLWLAARNDLTQNVEDMAGLAGSSKKDLWIYEGSSLHGTFIFDGADGPDLARRLLEFVAGVTT